MKTLLLQGPDAPGRQPEKARVCNKSLSACAGANAYVFMYVVRERREERGEKRKERRKKREERRDRERQKMKMIQKRVL